MKQADGWMTMTFSLYVHFIYEVQNNRNKKVKNLIGVWVVHSRVLKDCIM